MRLRFWKSASVENPQTLSNYNLDHSGIGGTLSSFSNELMLQENSRESQRREGQSRIIKEKLEK